MEPEGPASGKGKPSSQASCSHTNTWDYVSLARHSKEPTDVWGRGTNQSLHPISRETLIYKGQVQVGWHTGSS